jgi:hypothetical protein
MSPQFSGLKSKPFKKYAWRRQQAKVFCWLTIQPGKWRQYVPPKRRLTFIRLQLTSHVRNLHESGGNLSSACCLLDDFLLLCIHLIMKNEATYSSETSVGFQRTTGGYVIEDRYDVVSVNRSQMDIKRRTCDIRTWKTPLFLDISSNNIDTLFLVSLSLRRNPQHKSISTAVSATTAPPFQPRRHQWNLCNQGVFLGNQTDESH